jgi:hypothetical protein
MPAPRFGVVLAAGPGHRGAGQQRTTRDLRNRPERRDITIDCRNRAAGDGCIRTRVWIGGLAQRTTSVRQRSRGPTVNSTSEAETGRARPAAQLGGACTKPQAPNGCWLEPDTADWAVGVRRFRAVGGATLQSRASRQTTCSVVCGISMPVASREVTRPAFAALGCSGAFPVRLGLRHGK